MNGSCCSRREAKAMNSLRKNKLLQELNCENNLSYVLEDSAMFQHTEFKVLCHQRNSVFVESSKMLLNGKIQLYYFTGKYLPISAILKHYQRTDELKMLAEIYGSLLEIKKIGFLSIGNILTDEEHVFVDSSTSKIKWIYLPISTGGYRSEALCEKEVLENIKKMISPFLIGNGNGRLLEILDENDSLEQILAQLKNIHIVERKKVLLDNIQLQLRMTSIGQAENVVLIDDKDEYLVGRKASAVDGLITGSNLVGRVHCKISRNGYGFIVTDLQSTNGTYVNGEKIRPNESAPLSDGDRLRLANIEFKITVEEKNHVNS